MIIEHQIDTTIRYSDIDMKITLASNELHDLLQSASRLASSNIKGNQLSASTVLLEVADGKLSVTSTDLETRLHQRMDLVSGGEGESFSFTVAPTQILTPIGELPTQNITLDFDPEEYLLQVTYSNGNFQIPVSRSENFPEATPLGDRRYTLEMKIDDLYSGLFHTLYTTQTDESSVMSGVHVDARQEYIGFVGTNGYFLGLYKNFGLTHELPEAEGELIPKTKDTFTLPKKSAKLLMSLLDKMENQSILINVSDNFVSISSDGLLLQCRLLGMKYPNYESVIPKNNDKELIIDRAMFLSALKRVSIFTDQAIPMVSLDISGNELLIRSRLLEYSSSAEERIPVSFSSEETVSMNFDPNLLKDVLNNFKGENVLIKIGDASRAIIVSPMDHAEEEDITATIMPVLYGNR